LGCSAISSPFLKSCESDSALLRFYFTSSWLQSVVLPIALPRLEHCARPGTFGPFAFSSDSRTMSENERNAPLRRIIQTTGKGTKGTA
jgi:hypothetical protein